MFLSSTAFVRNIKGEKKKQEAYDGNVWLTDLWSRTCLMLFSTFQILAILCALQLSFTDFYGENIVLMMAITKLLGMLMENALERVFGDLNLISPFSSFHGISENVLTFGASSFLDFLGSYYIELGIIFFVIF